MPRTRSTSSAALRVVGEVDAQRDGVDEEPHQLPIGRAAPGWPTGMPITMSPWPLRRASRTDSPACSTIGKVASRRRAQARRAFEQGRREHHVDPVPRVALQRRAGAIGGQLEQLRARPAARRRQKSSRVWRRARRGAFALLLHVVRVLRLQRRQRVGESLHEGGVEGGDIAHQDRRRQAVGHHVVQRHTSVWRSPAMRNSRPRISGPARRSKRAPHSSSIWRRRSASQGRAGQVAKILRAPCETQRGGNALHRLPVDLHDGGAQHVVPRHQGIEAAPQGLFVQRPADSVRPRCDRRPARPRRSWSSSHSLSCADDRGSRRSRCAFEGPGAKAGEIVRETSGMRRDARQATGVHAWTVFAGFAALPPITVLTRFARFDG